MSVAGDVFAASLGLLGEIAGTVTGTYSQVIHGVAANTKSLTGSQLAVVRGEDADEADRDTCTLAFARSGFASGFTGANPVTPSGGDTFTISGQTAWVVGRAIDAGEGAADGLWILRCTRLRARGSA